MRHLICQNIIFHRTTSTTCSDIQRQLLTYVDEKNRTEEICDLQKLQGKDNFVSNRQDNDLWIKMLSPDTEISQRETFNEYELVQDKNLKKLGTTENIEQTYGQDRLGNNDNGQLTQLF